jgi:uncharacterized membrane protein YsdA (DUF1294 family)
VKRKPTLSYLIFGTISLFLTALFFYLLLPYVSLLSSYLIAVNCTTFLFYGYDKLVSSSNKIRIPEKILHLLAFAGGSPMALFAQHFFRHKVSKKSFQVIFWMILLLQAVVYWYML